MIVVTGGAGFIGSCIVARLNQMGHDDLIIVDHLDDEGMKQKNFDGKKYSTYYDKVEFLQKVLNGDLDGVDSIIHMGACSSTTGTDADYYKQNNLQYTQHLAQWCFARSISYIYASSAATYGDGECGYNDDESMLSELKPLNLYGWSKHNFDQWVIEKGFRDKVVGLKFFNVFGPNEFHKKDMRSVVNKAYPRMASEGKITLFKSHRSDYKDGEQKRDFIYVKDVVDVVIFFLEHPEIHGIYNVGTGRARSWNDLADVLFAAVGKEPDIEYIDMPDHLQSKYQYFTQASMDKIRSVGYDKSFTSLEDSVKDYVQNYLSTNSYM